MSNKKTEEETKPRCFVIMPISDTHGYESGHFGRVYEHVLKPAIIQAGYQPVRADDAVKTDYIVVGIIRQIVEADVVLCDYSARNPNVMYELGIRHAFNKPVVLIKDRKTEKIFDIQGLRYTEYDESLRIDSVQKDIAKITAAIQETTSSSDGAINSVVELANIRAAEVPAGQTVSADTGILLQAISSLESRISGLETNRQAARNFYFSEDKVVFHDKSDAKIGTEVFDSDSKFELVGELIDIHPVDDKIFIKSKSGKIVPFYAYSLRSKGLTGYPF